MTIIKSQKLAYDQTILQYEGKYYAIISVALGFSLKNAENFIHEQDLNTLWNELNLGSIPLNEGFIKPKAEVMVVGKVPAPEKHSRYTMRLQMKGIDKSIVVFSPRKWVPGPLGTFVMDWDDAQASREGLALVWQNAWGGEGYSENVEGTGFAKGFIAGRSKLYEGLAVPPFEVVTPGIQSPSDQNIPPAGFSPIRMTDPRRFQYFGESADYWQKAGLPTLPKDFNFQFFQRAPLDQQREAKFMPGESYQIDMGDKVIAGTLPQFKVRLLLADAKFDRMLDKLDRDNIADIAESEPDNPLPEWFHAHSIEQPMEIDTVILIPQALKGIVISRACFEVKNVHMSEWEHTLLALEHPDDPKTLQDLQQSLCDQLQDAALLKPSDAGLTADNKMAKEVKQKAKADKIFAKMQKAFKNVKPSKIASQQVRIKASIRSVKEAKDPNFIDYDFRAGELTAVKLEGLKLQNCTFSDIDFTETIFSNCSFLDCRFINCTFYQTKLLHCQLVDCQFQAGDARQMEVDNTQFQNVILAKTLLNQASIRNCHMVNSELRHIDAEAIMWNQTHIVGGAWKQCNFKYAQLSDLRVQKLKVRDSDFTHVRAHKCMFNDKGMAFIRVDFSNSHWEAPNFMQSYWYKVKVDKAKMPNGVWGFSKMIRTQFKATELNDSLFADSKFLSSHITDSNLKNSVFEGAWVKDSSIIESNNVAHVNLQHVQFLARE